MDDLVQWLGKQLDEDERVARGTGEEGRRGEPFRVFAGESGAGVIGPGVVEHIARHSPARVLREVDAKRQVLAIVQVHIDAAASTDYMLSGPAKMALVVLKPVVVALAMPYADRPGYREEWRP
ncbi:DUF6221 family protein (plasmid) [Streptomyces sp. Q6]|uniref:DUF6221 family protein n=1 Tax=Streptomyces citrinus TaxID=3118173 RepID=A0ACD5AQR0_9ACTN